MKFVDKDGCGISVGDYLDCEGSRGGTVKELMVDLGTTRAVFAEHGVGACNLEKFWTVTKRSDGSSPSADPRAGNGAEERFLPGAVWVRESGQFTDAIVVGYGQYRQRSVSGYLEGVLPLPMHAVRTYAGNLSDLVAGLQAVHRGRDGLDLSLKNVQRIVAEAAASLPEKPLTFPTCSACGERMPGAECGMPACAQVRKWAAMRKREEGLTEQYAAFRVAAKEAVRGTRVRVVTDMAHTLRRGVMFVAELSIDGMKKTLDYEPGAERTFVMASIDIEIDRFTVELGKRALRVVGGGR